MFDLYFTKKNNIVLDLKCSMVSNYFFLFPIFRTAPHGSKKKSYQINQHFCMKAQQKFHQIFGKTFDIAELEKSVMYFVDKSTIFMDCINNLAS
jgi:hypothetical protein